MKNMHIVFSFIIAILFTGCATTGALTINKPVSTPLSNYKNILVKVETDIPDSGSEALQLEGMMIGKIREKKIFEGCFSVSGASTMPDSSLALNIQIIQLRKVKEASRVLVGALAGQAKAVVNGQIVNPTNNENLASFTAEGESSGGSVLAGTTEQALERVAEQVADFISISSK